MVGTKVLAGLIIVCALVGGGGYYALTQAQRIGLSASPIAPIDAVPAAADVFIALDRDGSRGTTLTALAHTYMDHQGTAAALHKLRGELDTQGIHWSQVQELAARLGDRAALALWFSDHVTSRTPSQDDVHFVAATTLHQADLLSGKNPLSGFATVTSAPAYKGTLTYRISIKASPQHPAYGALVQGVALFALRASDLQTAIDVAMKREPSLSTNADYTRTVAALNLADDSRVVTAYVSTHTFSLLNAAALARARRTPTTLSPHVPNVHIAQPWAGGVSGTSTTLVLATSPLSLTTSYTSTWSPTTDATAGVVSNGTVVYASWKNLASTIRTIVRAGGLSSEVNSMEQHLGLSLDTDVLSWMSDEGALAITNESSPAMQVALSASSGSGATSGVAAALPGSAAIVFHISNPHAVQSSLDRMVQIAQHAMGPQASGHALFVQTTTPDGTIKESVSMVPALGYAIKGHWLIFSSNLDEDTTVAHALSTDPSYHDAMADLNARSKDPVVGTQYYNVDRLLGMADQWVAYGQHLKAIPTSVTVLASPSTSSGPSDWTWPQLRSLIAPIDDVTVVARHNTAGGVSAQTRIALH